MCMNQSYNNEEEALKIFNSIIKINDFNNITKYFTLLHCSRKILNNRNQYDRGILVTKDILELFNNNNINLENDEIVIPMFELKEDMAKLHISLYDSDRTVKHISNMISLNNYFNNDYTMRTQIQLSKFLMSIKESEYWTNKYNCENLTMTDQFLERTFKFSNTENKMKKTVINNIINKNYDNYQLTNIYKPEEYVDMASIFKSQQKRSYYATIDNNDLAITKEQVTDLFHTLTSEKDMYDLFNTLLISKEYCHMVLNNATVLTIMEPIINKFLPLYKYLFGYAWIAFYIEECLFKTKTTKNSRYVFDIRTACKLPVFPYSFDDIYQSPYNTLLISKEALNIQNNLMGLGMTDDLSRFKIDTLERFKWKFNLFTTGDPTINIFDGLEWSDRYAVSGSIINAFLQTKPLLIDLFAEHNNNQEEIMWLKYFNEYYGDSDIDFMCNDVSIFDFIDSINNVKNIITQNLNKNPEVPVNVNIEPIKTTTLIITETYIEEKLNDIRAYSDSNITIKEVIASINTNEIKEYFYGIYIDMKRKNNHLQRMMLKKRITSMYEDYFKIASIDDIKISIVTYDMENNNVNNNDRDCETSIYLNDVRDQLNQVIPKENKLILKIAENIKFKIRSDKMQHCIEAFRARSSDFFSVVGKFHLPCVRGYYNGETVYLEPSCITANISGINIDYKYFAGMRDPVEIINKYGFRGKGVIMNKTELKDVLYYNTNMPETCKIFGTDKKNIVGFRDVNDDMYKVNHFTKGIPVDIYKKVNTSPLKTMNDIYTLYATKYNYNTQTTGIDFFKFTTINQEGSVNPLQKWVIDAAYHLLK